MHSAECSVSRQPEHHMPESVLKLVGMAFYGAGKQTRSQCTYEEGQLAQAAHV